MHRSTRVLVVEATLSLIPIGHRVDCRIGYRKMTLPCSAASIGTSGDRPRRTRPRSPAIRTAMEMKMFRDLIPPDDNRALLPRMALCLLCLGRPSRQERHTHAMFNWRRFQSLAPVLDCDATPHVTRFLLTWDNHSQSACPRHRYP